MNKLLALLPTCLMFCCTNPASAGDWITAPSYYTHDPMSGERVKQYSPIGPFYTYSQPSFIRSGYRNTRSSIQVGTSADHYHTTEQWGAPIQPYGEWRFPYRPYSVPYDQWGPQFYGGFPLGRFPYGAGRGFGGAGLVAPGLHRGPNLPPFPGGLPRPNANPLQPGYGGQQQLLDGRYPPFEQLGPFERKQLFDHLYPPQAGAGD